MSQTTKMLSGQSKMADLSEIIHIGVVHYSPLTTRKAHLRALNLEFPDLNWTTERDIPSHSNYRFVDEINLMTEFQFAAGLRLNSFSQQHSRFASSQIIKLLKFGSKFSKRARMSILGALPQKKPLPHHWYEVSLMHIEALERGVSSDKDWILILEDDAIIQEHFLSSLEVVTKISKIDKVWINLNDGTGPNLFKNKSDTPIDFQGFYKVLPPTTRCTVAYLVNRELAVEILKELSSHGIPNWIPIDFTLDAIIKKLKVLCIWQDPACVLQGSSNGNYESNLKKMPVSDS